MFLGNPGTIRAPQHTFLQNGLHTATFAGHHKSGYHGHHFRKSSGTGHHRKQGKSLENVVFSRLLWRRRWDSNPRALADYLISSQARYDHFDTSPQYNYSVLGTDNMISSQPRYDHFDTAAYSALVFPGAYSRISDIEKKIKTFLSPAPGRGRP